MSYKPELIESLFRIDPAASDEDALAVLVQMGAADETVTPEDVHDTRTGSPRLACEAKLHWVWNWAAPLAATNSITWDDIKAKVNAL